MAQDVFKVISIDYPPDTTDTELEKLFNKKIGELKRDIQRRGGGILMNVGSCIFFSPQSMQFKAIIHFRRFS